MSQKPFDAYAAYYDLLYSDKDYSRESELVAEALKWSVPNGKRILELGCGTGGHARELIARGYTVHGIDSSSAMLDHAAPIDGFTCAQGDARTYRDGTKYDAVLALFHVMSYLTSREDLSAAIDTAAAHLEPGGVFGFDMWYGPAVYANAPERRERTMENDRYHVRRTAIPEHVQDELRVDVQYDIEVTDRSNGNVERFSEVHPMRYICAFDIEHLLDMGGFDLVEKCESGTGAPLTEETWSAWFVGRKR